MKSILVLLLIFGLGCGDRKSEAPTGPKITTVDSRRSVERPNRSDEIPVLLGDAQFDGDVDFYDTQPWLGFLNTGSFFRKPTENVDTLRNFILRIDCNCNGWFNIGDIYSLLAFFDSTGYGIDPWPGGLPGCLPAVSPANRTALARRYAKILNGFNEI